MFRTAFKWGCFLVLAVLWIAALSAGFVGAISPSVEVLHVDGTIVPIVADYLEKGITEAEFKESEVCIIELDTPGGLLNSTEDIVQRIMNAEIPVVVYVSPSGAWAASAGTFITIAAHIAVMAPGTTIGAAHPVSVGQEMPETQIKKVTEYSAAWIRSIAEKRGRNPEEAELAVSESKSFTAAEALEANIIDLQSDSLENLIAQLNGSSVTLASGKEVVIETDNYVLSRSEMNWFERFLHAVSDPNIAYILLTLATIGLITEISNPGLIFPGVIGGICLLIAFYSLGTLNAYWVGILLFLLAIGLFVTEIFVTSFGILTAGGIASLVVGSLILFAHNPPEMEINRVLIIVVSLIIAAFVALIIGAVVRGQRRRVVTGIGSIVGKTAIAKTRLNPKGMVFVDGELWTATVDSGIVEPEEEVIVTKVEDGLKLLVTQKNTRGSRK